MVGAVGVVADPVVDLLIRFEERVVADGAIVGRVDEGLTGALMVVMVVLVLVWGGGGSSSCTV